MAYFANGSNGAALFEAQCDQCRFGEGACPIAFAQEFYNYDACNVPVARNILDTLVKDDGTCEMLRTFPELRQVGG